MTRNKLLFALAASAVLLPAAAHAAEQTTIPIEDLFLVDEEVMEEAAQALNEKAPAVLAENEDVTEAAAEIVSRVYPVRVYPARVYPARVYPARVHPARVHPARVHPARVYPARVYPARVYPARPGVRSEDSVSEPNGSIAPNDSNVTLPSPEVRLEGGED